jgi:AcrR family transcriptional regulator
VSPAAPSEGVRALRCDAARNRDRVLAAASAVFTDHGLDAGVAEVARAAGVGMGTVYRRFPTKEALIDAVVAETLDGIIAMATSALAEPGGGGLEKFLFSACAYLAEHRGCLPRLWRTDRSEVPIARELIGALLEDAKLHGCVRAELTATDLTVCLWSVRGILETVGDRAPEAWQRHLELLIAGMRPSAEPLGRRPMVQTEVDRVLTAPA